MIHDKETREEMEPQEEMNHESMKDTVENADPKEPEEKKEKHSKSKLIGQEALQSGERQPGGSGPKLRETDPR